MLILWFCLFFVLVYGEFKKTLDFVNDRESVKKLSWFFTSVISSVFTIEGICYALPALLYAEGNFSHFVLKSSARSIIACKLFIAFCLVDLIMGRKDYRDYVSIMEGYFHHAFYICMLLIFLKYDAANAFWAFSWCEIPTCFMALSRMGVSVQRSLFPISFIFFRVILFDFFVMKFFISASPYVILLTFLPSAAVVAAHSWWGYKIAIKTIHESADFFRSCLNNDPLIVQDNKILSRFSFFRV
jgi:hypothetical protein